MKRGVYRPLFLIALVFVGFLEATPVAVASFLSPALLKVNYADLPGWKTDTTQQALAALQSSCRDLSARHRHITSSLYQIEFNRWFKQCQFIMQAPPLNAQGVRSLIENHFTPYEVTHVGSPDGFFTGYYQPVVRGSLRRDDFYNVPIYAPPSALKVVDTQEGNHSYRLQVSHKLQALPDRAGIEHGTFSANLPIIAWVHGFVDRYFMQVQGSGTLLLENGQLLQLGYAGHNGWSHFPIGRYLMEVEHLPPAAISMQYIRSWLNSHPEQVEFVLDKDPSFVFFKKTDHRSPVGSEGVELSPGRSIAVDVQFIALGTPIWLSSYCPNLSHPETQGLALQRLVVAQDQGGAIKGPIRGDIFWGHGILAEQYAGHMHSPGRYWVLLPNSVGH